MTNSGRPLLIVVCGPPAAGKTAVAAAVGRRLALPVISKDAIKEALMDHLGGAPAVGTAAFAVQFSVARELLRSGCGLILEGAFFRDQHEVVELSAAARTLVIELSCRLEVLERRYTERVGHRHPLHRGLEALPDLRERVAGGLYGAPDLDAEKLGIDTSDGVEPAVDEAVEWAAARMSPP